MRTQLMCVWGCWVWVTELHARLKQCTDKHAVSISTCCCLIGALAKAGRVEEASALFDEMTEAGVPLVAEAGIADSWADAH